MSSASAEKSQGRTLALWRRALLVADFLARDPHHLQGVCLRAGAGPVRDAWLAYFVARLVVRSQKTPQILRLPLNASDDRLLGGLDLVATLASGRPVVEPGLLARANGGVLLVSMAERMTAATSSKICSAMDSGYVEFARDGLQGKHAAQFVLIAFDEGAAQDERPPASLLDRLAFHLDLSEISAREVEASPVIESDESSDENASLDLMCPEIDDEQIAALCGVALAFGISSLRAAQLAIAAARTSAAAFGRNRVAEDDVTLAAELVLAAQAKSLPQAENQTDENVEQPGDEGADQRENADSRGDADDAHADHLPGNKNDKNDAVNDAKDRLPDRVIEAVHAAIPAALLAQMRMPTDAPGRGQRSGGSTGRQQISKLRGRPLASRRGDPRSGARLDVLATIRAAAPWQTLRRAEGMHASLAATQSTRPPILIRRDDWHVARRAHRGETLTLFAVDASGSAALHRLAEAKGAAELLLAECYVRRDQVAVVSFRGNTAETLLPPTRSLVRAKRSLAALPGGGGTPLAAGIDMAYSVADAAQRRGISPTLVFLTDGRANIARDGSPGRPKAAADALLAAKRLRSGGFNVLMIDTSPEPQDAARALAAAMCARYLGLPYADASVISAAVQSQQRAAP